MRWLAALVVMVMLQANAWADAQRVVVPIAQVMLPDGDIRYTVPVSIGGSGVITALLDTGSTGLRVFRGQVAGGAFVDTRFVTQSAFSAGDNLSGTIGTGVISVGDAATDAAIPFELVDAAACMDTRPNCGAALVSAHDYGIGGDGIAGQGFQAILGISLTRAADSENPLLHMGSGQWLIKLPEPVPGAVGALIINPDADDVRDMREFALQHRPEGGWVDALPGCLNNTTLQQQICGPTILDTGSPGMIAFVPGAAAAPLWHAGDAASLSFSGSGTTNLAIPFVVDRDAGTGMLQQPGLGALPEILGGFLPFFYNAVLYDGAAGRIGLQPRDDAPNPETNPLAAADQASSIQVIQMNAPVVHAGAHQGAPAMPVVITPGQ